jgi:hypothetical protein
VAVEEKNGKRERKKFHPPMKRRKKETVIDNP